MQYGLSISRPNKDVNNCEDKDLIYSTKFRTPQPIKCLKVPASSSVPHGLQFAPAFAFGQPMIGYEPIISVDDNNAYNHTDADFYVYIFNMSLNE